MSLTFHHPYAIFQLQNKNVQNNSISFYQPHRVFGLGQPFAPMWLFKVINMKRIPLTQGKFALVDDEDYDWLMTWKWYANRMGSKSTHYAASRTGGKIIHMHRLLFLYPSNNLIVDHIDHNGLNNQKHNLRVVTQRQNLENRRNPGTSKYPGVCWDAWAKKWKSSAYYKNKGIHLGNFDTEIEAAIARQNFVAGLLYIKLTL